jgi:TPP-dependent trihydroxycyclohexane-1,2-dione (THcHDO) dehydratase
MMATIRLTAAQAMMRWLSVQMTEDGERFIEGVWAIFGDVAQAWMRGETKDAEAIAEMAQRFTRLCGIWENARANAREAVA